MYSSWNDEDAILRDLSHAQGRKVPVEIKNAVGVGDKPPALNLVEATEESFFANCVGDGDTNVGPDLQLIQKMLDEVRGNPEDTEEKKIDKSGDIQTVNHECNLQVTVVTNKLTLTGQRIVRKPRKGRNITKGSLISTYGALSLQNSEDRVKDKSFFKSQLQESHSPIPDVIKTDVQKPISVAPEIMFKRKSKLPVEVPTFKEGEILDRNTNSNPSGSIEKKGTQMYIPSELAGELFQKFSEQSKLQEEFKEDIWTRAERQMKERELERQREIESEHHREDQDSELKGIDFIMLSQHRHLLGEECVVCDVLCVRKPEYRSEGTM